VGGAAPPGVRPRLPLDHVAGDADKKDPQNFDRAIPAGRMGLDIGPGTIRTFSEEIAKAKLVLWNGPVGLFEVPPYDRGSKALAEVLANNHPKVTSIIAGGDTVAAVTASGVEAKISHLSTGGGATLEFLEGRELPGIKALELAQ
jgi:phosphoglycerate kinase